MSKTVFNKLCYYSRRYVSSSTVIKPTTQNPVKYLGPQLNLTRWQRFFNYMKTPEAGLWPMGLMVAGAHVFFGYYLFSEEFLDDFADDVEAPTVVKVSLPLFYLIVVTS